MIIRALLIIAIVGILLWFLGQRTTTRGQAWSKVAVILVVVLAIIAVIAPSATNQVANYLGVGRGADLLLYVLTVLFLASILGQYLYRQDEQHKMIQLARKVAILEAARDPHNVAIASKTIARHQ